MPVGDACAMKCGLRNLSAFAVLIAIILSFANFSTVFAGSKISCYRVAPKPWVCLTIDDGYSVDAIKSMLSQLKRNNVKCTFFIIGCNLLNKAKQPLWRQAVKDGNEICYHSMNHRYLPSMSNREINADITAWEKAARKVLGRDYTIPKYARLPGGGGSYN
jgi:peptidoglycan-N-acetylmuramic acid deacetylase